jgi:hypothetical protein
MKSNKNDLPRRNAPKIVEKNEDLDSSQDEIENLHLNKEKNLSCRKPVITTWIELRAGVGNSFGFTGHIRDNLGIRGPVHVHVK